MSDRGKLVKNHVSERLRFEILNGILKPGDRIVVGKWAAGKFGVAQASIREAINMLSQAGFITKAPRRSARVIHWNETDIGKIYELRGAIEGVAARLAAKSPKEVVLLQATMDEMRKAANMGNREGL